jgi:excisionase family DNA binding protein
MEDQLIRNERTYISTSLASELTGYSRDYVGQLARDGHVESVKVGHKRFVDRDEIVEYGLENKTDLSLSDIPDNHVSNISTEQESDGHNAENDDNHITETGESRTDSDTAVSVTTDKIEEDWPQESAVIASEKMYSESPSSLNNPIRNQGLVGKQEYSNAINITDRPNRRWQKTADGLRAEGGTVTSRKHESKTPAVLATLFAIVLSLGLVAGFFTAASDTVGKVAHNVTKASQKAYYALGYGLDKQLEKHGAIGTVGNSVAETAGLIGGVFTSPMTSEPAKSDQVAAAGSTVRNLNPIAAAGQSIIKKSSWLVAPIQFEKLSFDDYHTNHQVIARANPRDQTSSPNGDYSNTEGNNSTTTEPGADCGAVVVPAPDSAVKRQKKRREIRSQFSTTNSGVIQPRFDDRRGNEYMYVMVPKKSTSSTSSTAQE